MSFFLDALDRALERGGSKIVTLRRSTGTTNVSHSDVDCRAVLRSPRAEEMIAGVTQQQTIVIMSLTEINAKQWPGGLVQGPRDARVPKKDTGDKIKIDGRWCAVERTNPIWVDDVLVRLEVLVLG